MRSNQLMRRRVAVTGLGLVSPLGCEVDTCWQAIQAGVSGVRRITRFDPCDHASKIAAEVRDFDVDEFVGKKDRKKMDTFIQYGLGAATRAMEDSGLEIDDQNAERVGVIVGVGIGGLQTIEEAHLSYMESGLKRFSPFFIPKLIGNLAPAHISMRFGAKGVNFATTSACTSGAHGVGEAFRAIRDGYLDAAIAGGTEAGVTPLGVGGFAAMRALSTRNDDPEGASRPFDKGRDGFVIGEGAGIMILEEWEQARARGARIHAEIVGYGANADAFHMTQPAPSGALRCMALCLEDAGLAVDDVGYINAHGTSTPVNDANETAAIRELFGALASKVAVSSTKSMTGHLLGAAGGVEAVITSLALRDGILPPTINQEEPDPECDLDYVPNVAREADCQVALSNSFGFGGTNATLALRRVSGAE